MLFAATILGLLMLWRENGTAYMLVLVWAFIGIAFNRSGTTLVANAAWLTSALLILAIAIFAFARWKSIGTA